MDSSPALFKAVGSLVQVIHFSKHILSHREELGLWRQDHRWRNRSTKRQSGLNKCIDSPTWSVLVPCRFYLGSSNNPSYPRAVSNVQDIFIFIIPVFCMVIVSWTEQRSDTHAFLRRISRFGEVKRPNSGPQSRCPNGFRFTDEETKGRTG